VGTGLDESIGLLNPGRTTAKATIELIGSKQIVQAPKLVSIPIRPHSAKTIRLAHFLHASNHSVGGVSAIVSTTGSSRIVAERSMTYTGAAAGRTSQVGAVAPSTTIAVGPATASPTTDNVVLLNPGAKPATVDITLLRSGHKPLTPKALQGIKVGAGGRIKVPVGRWTAGTPMEALIHSDRPVVGERLSYSSTAGDYSALMGMPLVTPNVP
jgi:hypothetical protein